ncbi:MAG: CDP-archaeol synthase [Pyrinomonadaceae bacterium]|nr:CDP-archaeol synthase [Pyrinomonadaceae bacterium]
MKELLSISYLFSPLLLGLTAHGLCIKFNWLSFLCSPVDRRRTFRGKRIFGPNKTYRGIVAVGLGAAIGFGLQAIFFHRFAQIRSIELLHYTLPEATLLGFVFGAAAMLSELPNSFIKRQLDIAPGNMASGTTALIFYAFDQIDFLVGAWLVLALFISVTFGRVLWSLVFLFISHQIITTVGYSLGMRSTPR